MRLEREELVWENRIKCEEIESALTRWRRGRVLKDGWETGEKGMKYLRRGLETQPNETKHGWLLKAAT